MSRKGRNWKLILQYKQICQSCGIEFLSKLKTKSKWCSAKCKNKIHHKPNQRKYHLNQYGLTETSFMEILSNQSGVCAICQKVMIKPCIDHDHHTVFTV